MTPEERKRHEQAEGRAAYAYLVRAGAFAAVIMSSEEVLSLSPEDIALFRDDLAVPEPVLEQLRYLARVPGRRLKLSFATATVESEHNP